jgi:HlyD family secretion protein
MLKWLTITLSLIGLPLSFWAVLASPKPPPALPLNRPPAVNPYAHGIAAMGIVEPLGRSVQSAAPEPGLVRRVFVQVNDRVKSGARLFELDARPLEADRLRAQAAVQVAEQNLERLQSMPRPEDVKPLRAAVADAVARYEQAQRNCDRAQRLRGSNAISLEEAEEKKAALATTLAHRDQAQAQLDRILAGAWQQDLRVAQSGLEQARADLQAIQSRIDRLTVHAPCDAVVLKRYREPGEYAVVTQPVVVLGDLSALQVRALVDEQDAGALHQDIRAVASVPGKALSVFPLCLTRIEPLAVAKTQLLGSNTELVDTRVVEVVFCVQPDPSASIRLYPGQVLDVFIDTEPAGRSPAGPMILVDSNPIKIIAAGDTNPVPRCPDSPRQEFHEEERLHKLRPAK